jgi:hypothetical protein
LFSEGELFELLDHALNELRANVQTQDGDYVLGVSEIDLIAHFVEKYTLDVPELHEEAIYVRDRGEAQVDVSGERRYF